MKAIGFVAAILFGFMTPVCCYGESTQEQEIKEAKARVIQIDYVGSKITTNVYGNIMTFYVPSDVKIIRGTETISFVDIEEDDPLTIEYIQTAPLTYQAVTISDDNLGLGYD